MSTAGVGFSDTSDSLEAAVEAAEQAIRRGGIDRCDAALFFTTSKHDPGTVLRALRPVVGPDCKILGGHMIGVITNDRLGYEGSQLAIAILQSDTVRVDTFGEAGLPNNEHGVGVALGKRIKDAGIADDANLLVFYEKVRESTPNGPVMNHAVPFLDGMAEVLGAWPPTAGSILLGDMQWTPGSQCVGDAVLEQSALVFALSGGIRMDSTVLHALRPMSRYLTVTKADGAALLEFDGKPALDVVQDMFGSDADRGWEGSPFLIVVGLNRGSKFGRYREEDYVNNVCVSVDADRRALVMSESYLTEGTDVQLMRRTIDFHDVRRRVEALLQRIEGRKPLLAVYIDCVGRSSVFAGTDGEEATIVQETLGHIPLLGTYSGGELGIVGGDMFPMNFTAILNIFSEDGDGATRP